MPWKSKWLLHLTTDAYEDCSVDWILLASLQSLQKENNKLRSLNSSHSLRTNASTTALNEVLILYSARADIHMHNLCGLLNYK